VRTYQSAAEQTNEPNKVEKSRMTIDPFREVAAAMRSRQGFDGINVKFGQEAGWLASKDNESLNDAEMLALANDVMLGRVLWLDKKPADYQVGFVRDRYQPPHRDQLGHTDKKRWRNMKDDPWSQLTYFLPLVDLNNNILFIYSAATKGGKDCLANLLDAYSNNREQHREDAHKLPLVTLARDSYVHPSYGTQVWIPLLDIVKWIEPPANLKPIMPPASSNLVLFDSSGGNAKLIEHDDAKPDFGSENPSSDAMDDEIPF
jgi:hypothetical protein